MIEIRNLSRLYDGLAVVDDVSLTVETGQLAVLVGTSGSGKTTLLRMINRLVQPSSGQVLIDGVDTATLPAHLLRRRIGYAIQGHGLFPHRTVAQNIATVPRLLGWPRRQIDARVDELLALFRAEAASLVVPGAAGQVDSDLPQVPFRRWPSSATSWSTMAATRPWKIGRAHV